MFPKKSQRIFRLRSHNERVFWVFFVGENRDHKMCHYHLRLKRCCLRLFLDVQIFCIYSLPLQSVCLIDTSGLFLKRSENVALLLKHMCGSPFPRQQCPKSLAEHSRHLSLWRCSYFHLPQFPFLAPLNFLSLFPRRCHVLPASVLALFHFTGVLPLPLCLTDILLIFHGRIPYQFFSETFQDSLQGLHCLLLSRLCQSCYIDHCLTSPGVGRMCQQPSYWPVN